MKIIVTPLLAAISVVATLVVALFLVLKHKYKQLELQKTITVCCEHLIDDNLKSALSVCIKNPKIVNRTSENIRRYVYQKVWGWLNSPLTPLEFLEKITYIVYLAEDKVKVASLGSLSDTMIKEVSMAFRNFAAQKGDNRVRIICIYELASASANPYEHLICKLIHDDVFIPQGFYVSAKVSTTAS